MGGEAAADNEAADEVSKDTEQWSDDRYSLKVTAKEGFFCTIRLAAVLPLPPSKAFEVLARPDSHRIFKSITANTYRKVLRWRDRRTVRLQVETEALAKWRFAVFSGTFATRLIVDLDQPDGTIDFKLARPGMMKAFEGHWTVQPYNGRNSLEAIVSAPTDTTLAAAARQAPRTAGSTSPFEGIQRQFSDWMPQAEAQQTLLTLEQSLMPKLVPPGPIGSLVKSISAAQVRAMLSDLQAEAARINSGKPTPSDSSGFADEFGLDDGGSSGCGSSGGSAEGASSTTAVEQIDENLRAQPLHCRAGSILAANLGRARQRRQTWLSAIGLDGS